MYADAGKSYRELKALSFAIVPELRKHGNEMGFKELKQRVKIVPFKITMGDIRKLEEGGGDRKRVKRIATRWHFGEMMIRPFYEFEEEDKKQEIPQKEYKSDWNHSKQKWNQMESNHMSNWVSGNE